MKLEIMTAAEYLAKIGRKGGKVKSPAKTAAVRLNAKRPRKNKSKNSLDKAKRLS